MAKVSNVLFVHGAWANSSAWEKVLPLIDAAGLTGTAVSLSLTSLTDDVATVKRAITLFDGPVLLVGHSYGGAVITEAGTDPKVAGLVYVAAFAPDEGEVVGELGRDLPPPPGVGELRPDAGGYLSITPKGIEEDFAPDLSPAERKVMIATQGPTNGACFGTKISNPAWRVKPSWYVIASNDRMIPPDLERKFAKAMNAKTLTLPSSHVPMLSHPEEVARFVAEAATTVTTK